MCIEHTVKCSVRWIKVGELENQCAIEYELKEIAHNAWFRFIKNDDLFLRSPFIQCVKSNSILGLFKTHIYASLSAQKYPTSKIESVEYNMKFVSQQFGADKRQKMDEEASWKTKTRNKIHAAYDKMMEWIFSRHERVQITLL